VEKDKTLRQCIDYRGLNDITVKNRFPLPLLSSAFEHLQWSTVFSMLDIGMTTIWFGYEKEINGRRALNPS
jgi:hypothetical protein